MTKYKSSALFLSTDDVNTTKIKRQMYFFFYFDFSAHSKSLQPLKIQKRGFYIILYQKKKKNQCLSYPDIVLREGGSGEEKKNDFYI